MSPPFARLIKDANPHTTIVCTMIMPAHSSAVLVCAPIVNSLSLPKNRRVLRSPEFRTIYQNGTRVTSRYFTAFCLRETLDPDSSANLMPSRFGFTVPRAVGKACLRNRIKRRMRSAVQNQLDQIAPGWALVFNPRQSAAEAPFEDLCREVGRIFSRCKPY